MNAQPSARQLEIFNRARADRPVALFYEFRHRDRDADARCVQSLAKLAESYHGALRWSATVEQTLIGAAQGTSHASACTSRRAATRGG